jgi:hypothetical protein
VSVNIGIFEQEDKVLDAIRLLRESGAEPNEIRVIVGNREGAPLLASNGEVNLEELYEIEEAGEDVEDGGLPLTAAPLAAGYPVGSASFGTGPAGAVFAVNDFSEGSGSEKALREIGIPDHAAERCRKAVESGRYVLVADVSSEVSLTSLFSDAGALESMS